jgi:hypothetical protein
MLVQQLLARGRCGTRPDTHCTTPHPTPRTHRLLYLERLRLSDASYLAAEPRLSDIRPVIYVARASLENAQLIAWQIKQSRAST